MTTDWRYSYCGATKDFANRFRQHCAIIKGGAKYTTNLVKAGFTWRPLVVITGFNNQREALQMELCQKGKMDKYRIANLCADGKTTMKLLKAVKHKRIKVLAQTLLLKNWTSNSIDSDQVELRMYWYDETDIPIEWTLIMPDRLKENCHFSWTESPFS